MALAKGERLRAFKSVSPALLGPMGTVFGLLVVFSVVLVWSDMDRAQCGGQSRGKRNPHGGIAGP